MTPPPSARPADYPTLLFAAPCMTIWAPGVFVEIDTCSKMVGGDTRLEVTIEANDAPGGALGQVPYQAPGYQSPPSPWEQNHSARVLARLAAGIVRRVRVDLPVWGDRLGGEWTMGLIESKLSSERLAAMIVLLDRSA